MQLRARILAIVLILIFIIGAVASGATQINNNGATPTPLLNSAPTTAPVIFPTVPPNGTPVQANGTYFHPTGIISMPHIDGWDLAPQNGEETVAPLGDAKVTRVAATFNSPVWLSVIHVFAEKDPEHPKKDAKELDQANTKDALNAAWANFTGGWKEIKRSTDNNLSVIDSELYLDTHTYIGRQISKIDGEWVVTVRLVVPNNNGQLLDTLQGALLPKLHIWTQLAAAPLEWGLIADIDGGYAIKVPAGWKIVGVSGKPFNATGQIGQNTTTLDTTFQRGKTLAADADARAFVTASWPKATIITVKPATADNAKGFAVSYANPDSDGNPRSAVVLLLNGNNTLYIANIQTSAKGLDLLDPANSVIPVEFTQIRNSLVVIPPELLSPIITPATPAATSAK